MLGFLWCLLLGHEPDRRRVKKVAHEDYYGYCRRCNARLHRIKRDKWTRTRHWPDAMTDQGAGEAEGA